MWCLKSALVAAVLSSVLLGITTAGASSTRGLTRASVVSLSSKSAFCSANEVIDKASASVTTNAGFLAVLKTHASTLKVLQKNAPSGSLGQLVQEVVKDAEKAVAANNANDLNNLPNGGSIDTYCGVDGVGQPLPAYFSTGKSTAFCATFIPLFQAVGDASSQADVLTILTAHKSQISKLTSELSKLPSSIKATATTAVNNAQKAISEKNPAVLGNGAAMHVALYCGQNQ